MWAQENFYIKTLTRALLSALAAMILVPLVLLAGYVVYVTYLLKGSDDVSRQLENYELFALPNWFDHAEWLVSLLLCPPLLMLTESKVHWKALQPVLGVPDFLSLQNMNALSSLVASHFLGGGVKKPAPARGAPRVFTICDNRFFRWQCATIRS